MFHNQSIDKGCDVVSIFRKWKFPEARLFMGTFFVIISLITQYSESSDELEKIIDSRVKLFFQKKFFYQIR